MVFRLWKGHAGRYVSGFFGVGNVEAGVQAEAVTKDTSCVSQRVREVLHDVGVLQQQ